MTPFLIRLRPRLGRRRIGEVLAGGKQRIGRLLEEERRFAPLGARRLANMVQVIPADTVNPPNRESGDGTFDGNGDSFQGKDQVHLWSPPYIRVSNLHFITSFAVFRHNIRY